MPKRTRFSLFLLGAGTALLAACEREAPVAAPPETRAERLALLDQIAAECQAPRAMMELVGEDELRLRPPADIPYERLECVLGRIDGLNLPAGHTGFLGNEALSSPPANEAAAPEMNDAQAD